MRKESEKVCYQAGSSWKWQRCYISYILMIQSFATHLQASSSISQGFSAALLHSFSLSPYQSVGGVFQVERPCRHHKNLLSISPYYTNRSIVGGRSVGRNEALRDNNEYDK